MELIMSVSLSGYGNPNSPNFWAGVKQFAQRGGFANGLNPNIVGRIWYVNTNTNADAANKKGSVGSDSNSGLSPLAPFATVARALTFIDCYDIIVIDGVVKEQVVAPLGVFDVTLIGAANTPRQATSGGVATGGGAYWTSPTSPTAATPLLELIEQGWSINNICFNPVASSPAIQATRAETAAHPDPSHLSIDGCLFIGAVGTVAGQIGYQDSGGCYNVRITNSRFQALANAIKGIAGAGIADPLANYYAYNYFLQNTNDIVIGCSYGRIEYNDFKATTTKKISLTAGGHEIVRLNQLDDNAADIDPAHGYDGSATGTWLNYVLNQAALQVGQPA
jgi:hypothetical protein